jgi:hypothetical protein
MSQLKVNSVVDASGGNTATINTYTPTESNMGGKNRIINGDMRIDQRGGTITVNNLAVFYGIDRFSGVGQSADGVFTMVQDTSAPSGFVNSLKVTVTTADASIGASQYYTVQQLIEGTNVSDLAWGTASAKTVTLSFWVRSSVTGTFGGSLRNANGDRSYPFTYSISAANTWEQKTVTVAGDTSGTWLTTTGIGIRVNFGIGTGSSGVGTAGAWAGANYYSATGATNLISTLSATFYITGVQLEVGSVATPFERRDYGRELIMCQRYFFVAVSGSAKYWGMGQNYSASALTAYIQFPVTMRAAPTSASTTGTNYYGFYRNGTNDDFNSITLEAAQVQGTGFFNNSEISGTAGQSGNPLYQ